MEPIDKASLKNQIVETFLPFNPEKVILFGSMARADHDSASDVDLIIVYKTEKRFLDRLEELYLSWNIPRGVDILAYTPGEYERMLMDSEFLKRAVEEGELIYEAS